MRYRLTLNQIGYQDIWLDTWLNTCLRGQAEHCEARRLLNAAFPKKPLRPGTSRSYTELL